MSIDNNSTAPAPAATTDLYQSYSNPKALAASLKDSAIYLEHCAEKHNATGPKLRLYMNAMRGANVSPATRSA